MKKVKHILSLRAKLNNPKKGKFVSIWGQAAQMNFARNEVLFILLLLLFSLPALLPLFHPGFFLTDDGEWIIIRLSAFYTALREGQIPVRFVERLNFGYGYPVAEFLYPGIMYFGSIFHVLKIGFVDSVKIIMGLSLVGSLVFTYFWLQRFFTRSASIVGALVALYVPYRLYDAYTRGSVGELFALIWVPFILWMIERKNTVLISIGVALLILSHNTLALLFLPILFIYALLRKTISLKQLLISFALGAGLSGFFIIPAMYDLPYTVFSQTDVSNPFEYFANAQLIGYSSMILLLIVALGFFIGEQSFKKYKSLTLLFFVVSLIAIFLSSSLSSILWQIIPVEFVQFPFRLLSILTITLAFLAAAVITTSNRKVSWVIGFVLLSVLLYSSLPFSTPKSFYDKGEGFYSTNDATTTVQDEYMPKWVKEKPLNRPGQKVIIVKGDGTVTNIVSNNKKIMFKSDNNEDVVVQVNTVYWPGWDANVDGRKAVISYANPQGVMQLSVPKGAHQIAFTFSETPFRLFANTISIVSLAVIGFLFYKSRRV